VYNVAIVTHKRNSLTAQHSARFTTDDPHLARQLRTALRRLPPFTGSPVIVERATGLRDSRGVVHAGAFLRERRIAVNCTASEFPRIFVHELFHFVWLRAGNGPRHSFERLLRAEFRAGAAGELGWSAEWRKLALTPADHRERSRRWREYCCESFCDTAAWLYSGLAGHPEFTLASRFRRARRAWLATFVNSPPTAGHPRQTRFGAVRKGPGCGLSI
jgi:hypothetical protein